MMQDAYGRRLQWSGGAVADAAELRISATGAVATFPDRSSEGNRCEAAAQAY
jgi:hypothetical protein